MTPRNLTFRSGDADCDAWHFPGRGDAFTGDDGRPAVVMAHGLGGTKDSGLREFADRLADAGLDVVAFDYRGFGASGGTPRQRVDLRGQADDYRAALDAAAALDGVDRNRLVLWGVSLSGGHVLTVGAHRSDVAAVVAVTPLVDGPAAGRLAGRHHSARTMMRSAATGARSRVSTRTGRGPVTIPVVGRPGETAALTLDGSSRTTPSWPDRRGATRSTPASHSNSAPTVPARTPPGCAARCSSRSPTSTAVRRRAPPRSPPSGAAPRSATTRATTSASGRGTNGSTLLSRTRSRSCPGT